MIIVPRSDETKRVEDPVAYFVVNRAVCIDSTA